MHAINNVHLLRFYNFEKQGGCAFHPEGDPEETSPLTLCNEYGKEESLLTIVHALKEAGVEIVEVLSVTLKNYTELLQDVANKISAGEDIVVLNLCDGTEDDGIRPCLFGIKVATSPYIEITKGAERETLENAGNHHWMAPYFSYASLSISDKSIVHTVDAAVDQFHAVSKITTQGVFVERFFAGREFTAVVVGEGADGAKVYPVAERVFHPRLKKDQRILAFDRYWDGYDLQGGKGAGEPVYWYELAPKEWQEALQELSRKAYIACGGSGYGRIDIRTPNLDDCDPYVLEVNANCGLSFGKGSSSLGEVLELSNVSPGSFVVDLLDHARARFK
ncbi:hypothetical protein BC829DRAFT_409807 [Chytridium lagenaria]|nr:hypothetical protein BC829DRAFT_409807 [Chytridium lagenaria]